MNKKVILAVAALWIATSLGFFQLGVRYGHRKMVPVFAAVLDSDQMRLLAYRLEIETHMQSLLSRDCVKQAATFNDQNVGSDMEMLREDLHGDRRAEIRKYLIVHNPDLLKRAEKNADRFANPWQEPSCAS